MRWQEIPGFVGYRISDTGIIQSRWASRAGGVSKLLDAWRTLRQTRTKRGYLSVNLRKCLGKKQKCNTHVLVLLAFVGPRPQGCVARHLDGDQRNNCLVNLRWGTSRENSADTLRHGRRPMGEAHYAARLFAKDVQMIRASTESNAALAKQFQVSKIQIYQIRSGKRWREGGVIPVKRLGRKRKLTEDQILAIRDSRETQVVLAERYGVDQTHISRLKREQQNFRK